MDPAAPHLTQRRYYLRMARNIVTDRENSLKLCDSEYRARRIRLLLKLYLTTLRPQLFQKRQRLLARLGLLKKVKDSFVTFFV